MEAKVVKRIKIAVVVIVAGALAYGIWLGIPHLTGSRHNLPKQATTSPMALMEWIARSIGNDYSPRVWNSMTDEYRALFSGMFEKIKKGTTETERWLKVATDSGVVDDIESFRKLSDKKMFDVWWAMPDRPVDGFSIPLLMSRPSAAVAQAVVFKVFYETNPPLESKGGYILYQVGEDSDLLVMTRAEDGGWRIDVPREAPAGL